MTNLKQFSLIRTDISKAFWCNYDLEKNHTSFGVAISDIHGTNPNRDFLPPSDPSQTSKNQISWFDTLFDEGGLKIGGEKGKPITLLLTGPPGSGKTTLALELATRIALNHDLWSLFISTESDSVAVQKKIDSFGIEKTQGRIIKYQSEDSLRSVTNNTKGIITLYGQEHVQKAKSFNDIVSEAINSTTEWILNSKKDLDSFSVEEDQGPVKITKAPPIVVFDSLNMIDEPPHINNPIDFIVDEVSGFTKLIIVVLTDEKNSREYNKWKIACDNIIHLDYSLIRLDNTTMRDYYRRSIEIIKARYQSHKWGIHQMKIYGESTWMQEDKSQYNTQMRRAHPYREEGGVFIFPSIHSFLSTYKRIGPEKTSSEHVKTPSKGLNDVIKGFPVGRCTALMGVRGGHKSHLAYHHLLRQVVDSFLSGKGKKFALIISLRDDEGMTRIHLSKILAEEIRSGRYKKNSRYGLDAEKVDPVSTASELIDDLLQENLLEILYFPPGYITPDEFFHRMFMSIFRFKHHGKRTGKKTEVTVMFNSLDQLAARFPLCAHQPIFIPAMIHCLIGEEITSIFIAVNEPGQPEAQYGLLPMADLTLTFRREVINEQKYHEIHQVAFPLKKNKDEKREEVILEVSRFAGGRKAGIRGLLELVYSDQQPTKTLLTTELGLHFTEWDE